MRLLAVVLLCACAFSPSSAAAEPYNIVIIKTDDQRWDTVDRIIDGRPVMPETTARLFQHPNAIRFTNAITPIPNCCPERAAFFSGATTRTGRACSTTTGRTAAPAPSAQSSTARCR